MTEAWLLEQWTVMVRIRSVEEAVAELVDGGEARCPCHLCIGQEAVAAGVCAALEQSDTVWGGHRSHGHYLAKGGSIELLFPKFWARPTVAREAAGARCTFSPPSKAFWEPFPS